MINRVASAIAFSFVLALLHFYFYVNATIPEKNNENSAVKVITLDSNEDVHLSAKLLADLYGIKYEPKEVIPEDDNESAPAIIYLDQAKVFVRTISSINGIYLALLVYDTDTGSERATLRVGDKVLGYTLIDISATSLSFTDGSKELHFNIFKNK